MGLTLDQRREEKRFVLALVCAIAVAIGVALAAVLIGRALQPPANGWAPWFKAFSAVAIALGGVLAGMRIWHGRIDAADLHLHAPPLRWIALALAAVPLLFLADSALSRMLITAVPELPGRVTESPLPVVRDYERLVIAALATGLLTPLLEEILFRRYVLRALLPFGAALAIVASALAFGLLHGWSRQGALAVLGGLVYGWLYYRSGSLVPAFVAHAGLNLAVILLHFFAL